MHDTEAVVGQRDTGQQRGIGHFLAYRNVDGTGAAGGEQTVFDGLETAPGQGLRDGGTGRRQVGLHKLSEGIRATSYGHVPGTGDEQLAIDIPAVRDFLLGPETM